MRQSSSQFSRNGNKMSLESRCCNIANSNKGLMPQARQLEQDGHMQWARDRATGRQGGRTREHESEAVQTFFSSSLLFHFVPSLSLILSFALCVQVFFFVTCLNTDGNKSHNNDDNNIKIRNTFDVRVDIKFSPFIILVPALHKTLAAWRPVNKFRQCPHDFGH